MRKIECGEFTYIENKEPLQIAFCLGEGNFFIAILKRNSGESISEELIKQQFQQDDHEIETVLYNIPLFDLLYEFYTAQASNRLLEQWHKNYLKRTGSETFD